MANWIIRGRQLITLLTNESGGGVVNGDVVIVDDGDDNSFTTTAVEGQSDECIGVAIETIANNALGRICVGGEVEQVNLDGAANRRDWIKCDGVVKQATPQAAPGTGCFGQVLAAGATPGAIIWMHPLQAAGGGGGLDPAAYYGRNLIKNSPGQIVVDGAEPQWWDDSSDATLTDEDAAGEACSDLFERVFKLVTVSDDKYGYQTLTFADEELLDAGVTVVSFGCWVWCAAAATASIAIFGTNLGLQESAQHTGGSGWEWITIENITLNGADASIEARLICDTGTAFFTGPMLSVGPEARVWVPRGMQHIPLPNAIQVNLAATGDIAWSDTDCTANTDPLAIAVSILDFITEADGAISSFLMVGHSDDLIGGDQSMATVRVVVLGGFHYNTQAFVRCDDSQIIRYRVEEVDADNDIAANIWLSGYWMWE